jgi:hypothetical protein
MIEKIKEKAMHYRKNVSQRVLGKKKLRCSKKKEEEPHYRISSLRNE